MQILNNKVYLYNTREEIESHSAPYATEDAEELDRVISCFISWARMLAMDAQVAARLGEHGTAHIKLATDLRTAIKVSRYHHFYPKIVLPMSAYFSAKLLRVVSQSIGPEIAEMIEQENQRWEAKIPV